MIKRRKLKNAKVSTHLQLNLINIGMKIDSVGKEWNGKEIRTSAISSSGLDIVAKL